MLYIDFSTINLDSLLFNVESWDLEYKIDYRSTVYFAYCVS